MSRAARCSCCPAPARAKESHHDWARACRGAGWTALCVDLPGHGETGGALGAGVLSPLRAALAGLPAPWVLRGSSMGGYLALGIPVLLLHAEGDERVPVAHSRALASRLRSPASRLIAVPGGHHRSVQHDAELQGEALRWLGRAL